MNTQQTLPILHIGYPKTGTSWFQKRVFPRAKNIEFYNRKRIRREFGVDWKTLDDTNELKRILSRQQKRILISDESMIGGVKWIEHNLKNYKELFYPAQIIIFIRNQLDIHISAYSQYIKLGGTANFHDFLFPAADTIRAGKKHCYHSIIQRYKDTFGAANVYVYLFEDLLEKPGEFMNEFCRNHSLEIDFQPMLEKKSNRSLSKNLLRFKRYSNYLTRKNYSRIPGENSQVMHLPFYIPFWYELSLVGFEMLNRIFPGGETQNITDLIGREKTQYLKDFYKESNQQLISIHGLNKIKEYAYPL